MLVVYNYGLARTSGLATEMRTLIGLRAKLVGNTGGVLAERKVFVRSSDARLPAATLENFFKQPELLRAGFTKAAHIIATDMLAR
jgi:hypothetical protein